MSKPTICPDRKTSCENGSICTVNSVEEGTYFCDCNNSTKVADGAVYAGLYCEYIATSFCTFNQNFSPVTFCTNGGACNGLAASPNEFHWGCYCPDGFEGDHCELVQAVADGGLLAAPFGPPSASPSTSPSPSKMNNSTITDTAIAYCTTDKAEFNVSFCVNGGDCNMTLPQDDQDQVYVGCDCPVGYIGDHCEIVENTASSEENVTSLHPSAAPSSSPSISTNSNPLISICPDDHSCENGSACTTSKSPDNDEDYSCDCNVSGNNVTLLDGVFAGLHCRYVATSFCTLDQSESRVSFCTNQGECKMAVSTNDIHMGCDCPIGYEGDYCEFIEGTILGFLPTSPYPTSTPSPLPSSSLRPSSSTSMLLGGHGGSFPGILVAVVCFFHVFG